MLEKKIGSRSENGGTVYSCDLITDKGDIDIGTGFYSEQSENICDYFDLGKACQLTYDSLDEENHVYPLFIKK